MVHEQRRARPGTALRLDCELTCEDLEGPRSVLRAGEESAKDHLQSKQLRDHHKPDEQEKGSPDPDLGAPVPQP